MLHARALIVKLHQGTGAPALTRLELWGQDRSLGGRGLGFRV